MAKRTSATMDDLLTQATITNRLLAAQLRQQMNQQELVGLLMSTGATDREIADVLDTTPATVAVAKGRLRTKKQKKVTTTKAKSGGSDASDG